MLWCGVVLCCGVLWYGMAWHGVVWYGMVWCGMVYCSVVWCGVVGVTKFGKVPLRVLWKLLGFINLDEVKATF